METYIDLELNLRPTILLGFHPFGTLSQHFESSFDLSAHSLPLQHHHPIGRRSVLLPARHTHVGVSGVHDGLAMGRAAHPAFEHFGGVVVARGDVLANGGVVVPCATRV
jgi:hypothetical protein